MTKFWKLKSCLNKFSDDTMIFQIKYFQSILYKTTPTVPCYIIKYQYIVILAHRIQLCFIKVSKKVKSESLCSFESKYQLKACFSFKFVYIIHLHPKVCYQNADILRLLFRYMTNNATIFEKFSGTNQMWDTYTHTHTLEYTPI